MKLAIAGCITLLGLVLFVEAVHGSISHEHGHFGVVVEKNDGTEDVKTNGV